MKVNCEGAEVPVLDRLLDTGELSKVDELLVHFDCEKIPELRHLGQALRSRLRRSGVPYRAAEEIFFGRTVEEKTANWLDWFFASGPRRLRYAVGRRIEFAVRVPLSRGRTRWRARFGT